MAIITQAEAKAILQITVSTYDTLIDTLIPDAEGLFLIVRGIPFFEIEGNILTGSNTILEVTDQDQDKVCDRDYLEGTGVEASAYVTKVDYWKTGRVSITENTITMSAVATATTEDLLIKIYPANSKNASARIIGYLLSTKNLDGLINESIGTYNKTKFDKISGLPADIAGQIKQYQSIH